MGKLFIGYGKPLKHISSVRQAHICGKSNFTHRYLYPLPVFCYPWYALRVRMWDSANILKVKVRYCCSKRYLLLNDLDVCVSSELIMNVEEGVMRMVRTRSIYFLFHGYWERWMRERIAGTKLDLNSGLRKEWLCYFGNPHWYLCLLIYIRSTPSISDMSVL